MSIGWKWKGKAEAAIQISLSRAVLPFPSMQWARPRALEVLTAGKSKLGKMSTQRKGMRERKRARERERGWGRKLPGNTPGRDSLKEITWLWCSSVVWRLFKWLQTVVFRKMYREVLRLECASSSIESCAWILGHQLIVPFRGNV